MVSAELLPLALLYVDNQRAIEGITRLQKLVFLAQEESSLEIGYEYEADKYGPFSKELYGALDSLESRNLIKREVETTRSGNEKYTYLLTDRGRAVIKEILSNEEYEHARKVFEEAHSIKKQHNQEPLDTLLRYVYRKYPDYTENSTIKEDLF